MTVHSVPNPAGHRDGDRQRIYLASPLQTFNQPRYDRELAQVERHFPDAIILTARGMFRNNQEWRQGWPWLLNGLDAVVFFADDAGFVGKGTWTECMDAYRRGLPVHYLTERGDLYGFIDSDDIMVQINPRDWKRYALISRALTPEEEDERFGWLDGIAFGDCGAPDDICGPGCCWKARTRELATGGR